VTVSLRARLLIAMVVLVAGGLVVANVATYRYLSAFLVHRVDDQLVAAQGPAAGALEAQSHFGGEHHGGPEPILPPGTYAEYRNGGGATVGSPVVFAYSTGTDTRRHPMLPKTLPGSGTSSTDALFFTAASNGGGSGYRVLAAPANGGNGTLIVAIPLSEVDGTLHRLLIVALVVSGVVLLAMAGLALWLVRLGLRPLTGIGETAGAIAAGDLTRRVEPATERTEVGRLGLALNSMLSQIEASFDQRKASEQRLRRFVADASHELRTPLTSIRGYAELFRRGAGSRPEDLAKSMQRIEAEASRMGVLVDDLLLLARLDQGRPLERQPVDLRAVAQASVESARAVEPERSIELAVDGPAALRGDEGRLRQVIDNLIDNCRVHTPPGSPVRVAVGSDGGEVVLQVSDRGPGLSPETAGRVFERFYRGDPARSRETGGAGLGLSIVAAIVEAHGGRATATSSDGEGAVFEIRIPTEPPVPVDPSSTGSGSA
jgi:two-component system OmpR family sensor kinase